MQDLELGHGQINVAIIDPDRASAEMNPHTIVTGRQHFRLGDSNGTGTIKVSKQATHARDEQTRAYRMHDAIIGTRFQPCNDRQIRGLRTHHDHGDRGEIVRRPDPAHEIELLIPGCAQVCDDHVHGLGEPILGGGESLASRDLEPLPVQVIAKPRDINARICNHEYSTASHRYNPQWTH